MFPDTFETPRLILRPIAAHDAAPIFDTYAQDAEVTRYLTFRPHTSIADTEAYIARCLAATGYRAYVLTGRDDPTIRGALDVRLDRPHAIGYGYVLARRWWGQGLMTEALSEVVRWALSREEIWRIGDVCDVDNLASARVMEKSGLAREGILRRWSVHPTISDEPRDCFSYARTR